MWTAGRLPMGAWNSLAIKKGKDLDGEAPCLVRPGSGQFPQPEEGVDVGSQTLGLWSFD